MKSRLEFSRKRMIAEKASRAEAAACSVFLSLVLFFYGLACSSTNPCRLDFSANIEALPLLELPPGEDEVGNSYRIEGFYEEGFEKSTVVPKGLFDTEAGTDMGIAYCVTMAEGCYGIIRKRLNEQPETEDASVLVEGVAKYLGGAGPFNCVFGTIQIYGILGVVASE